MSDQQNMANRIQEAWASALGLPLELTKGLVHFPENAVYRFDPESPPEAAAFFRRASYLCKATTKQFGLGHHGFGASRH
ncbi:YagK/YfjJ domain-containing protein [Hydrogenophaga sp.]|uniref:YagK/YfjJ domain-containing protein n=1 Tax=Hydrogenophaga sp. TaxID=1904254 RepID=UPI003F6F09D1